MLGWYGDVNRLGARWRAALDHEEVDGNDGVATAVRVPLAGGSKVEERAAGMGYGLEAPPLMRLRKACVASRSAWPAASSMTTP